VDSYEAVVQSGHNPKATANICIIEMFAALNVQAVSFLDR